MSALTIDLLGWFDQTVGRTRDDIADAIRRGGGERLLDNYETLEPRDPMPTLVEFAARKPYLLDGA